VRLSLDPSADPGDYRFTHEVRVRFAETDAMGVVHHAAYLPYLEEARVALLRAAGRPYDEVRAGGVDLAVLEVFVNYRRPLRFDEVVRVHVQPGALTLATFQIAYLLTVAGPDGPDRDDDVRAEDGRAPDIRATAVTVHGCVSAAGSPIRVPAWLRALAVAA
jgi:acyl-CoA thioester hydrolase